MELVDSGTTRISDAVFYYLSRIENKTLKAQNMRLHNIAIQAKNDMKTLRKSSEQPRFVQHSQAVQHESDESLELTPMLSTPTPSPSSSSWQEENIQQPTLLQSSKKCFHCGLSFDHFDTRRNRLKHIRNCKRSGGSQMIDAL